MHEASYQEYVALCEQAGLTPMSFFECWGQDYEDLRRISHEFDPEDYDE